MENPLGWTKTTHSREDCKCHTILVLKLILETLAQNILGRTSSCRTRYWWCQIVVTPTLVRLPWWAQKSWHWHRYALPTEMLLIHNGCFQPFSHNYSPKTLLRKDCKSSWAFLNGLMLFTTAGVNKGVRPFKLLCLNSDPQCDTASQLKIEMLDESWMGDTFLESFMVSQVRMATPAPGSWQERDSRQERAGGKEWSPFLLWEPWDFGGKARREPVLSALLLFWESSTGGVQTGAWAVHRALEISVSSLETISSIQCFTVIW